MNCYMSYCYALKFHINAGMVYSFALRLSLRLGLELGIDFTRI